MKVMTEEIDREYNQVITTIGSGSTWGKWEKKRFKIKSEGIEVDATQLIGDNGSILQLSMQVNENFREGTLYSMPRIKTDGV